MTQMETGRFALIYDLSNLGMATFTIVNRQEPAAGAGVRKPRVLTSV
ncbi:hypothetical protein Val02_85510 [Virgisporangium aliadipatigenens]|uniref:Uncharacterized protein n=1 Tax=Virgisporangium aliadipatigenens TaxID=741659 RepID=A0A8J3YXS0_9ACTN|nr:hypothetical protein Val02_85510 [Virgisporangium aliadipatigenens]